MNPPTEGLCRATVLVILSRFRSWEDIHLIAPLWPDGNLAARQAVIDKFLHATKVSKDLLAELQRLDRLDKECRQKYDYLFDHYGVER